MIEFAENPSDNYPNKDKLLLSKSETMLSHTLNIINSGDRLSDEDLENLNFLSAEIGDYLLEQ